MGSFPCLTHNLSHQNEKLLSNLQWHYYHPLHIYLYKFLHAILLPWSNAISFIVFHLSNIKISGYGYVLKSYFNEWCKQSIYNQQLYCNSLHYCPYESLFTAKNSSVDSVSVYVEWWVFGRLLWPVFTLAFYDARK